MPILDKNVIKNVTEKIPTKEIVGTVKNVTDHINPNEIIGTIKGVTEHIDNNAIQKLSSGADFMKKILESRAASKLAKMAGGAAPALKAVGKHIPMIGGIATGLGTLLATGDASAALPAMIPVINESEGVGPEEGTLEHSLESGKQMSPKEMEILRNRFTNGR